MKQGAGALVGILLLSTLAACGRSALEFGFDDLGLIDSSTVDDLATHDANDDLSQALAHDLATSDLATHDLATHDLDAPDLLTPPDLWMPFTIAPAAYVVPAGRAQIFVANGATSWSVTEAGGGAVDGTAAHGNYHAPMTPGVYHLVASNGIDTATATITVADFALSVLAGRPGGPGFVDGIGHAARLGTPQGIATDGSSLFITETYSETIRKVTLPDLTVTTLAGVFDKTGTTDGVGNAARLHYPGGIIFDPVTSLLYVLDGNHTLRSVDPVTGEVVTVAGSPGMYGNADGIGSIARFTLNGPNAIMTDGAGMILILDSGLLRSFEPASNQVTTIVSTFGFSTAAAYDGGDFYFEKTASELWRFHVADSSLHQVSAAGVIVPTLTGLASDGAGHLYASDYWNNRIVLVDETDGTSTALAGSPTGAYGNDDGAMATFAETNGLVVLGGQLFVCDTGNALLRAIDLGSTFTTTLVGEPSHSGSADGAALASTFVTLAGLTADPAGTLYVSDVTSSTLRMLTPGPGAMVSTIAGTAGQAGHLDDVGIAARLRLPTGLVLDGQGGLYFGDERTLRLIDLASGAVTTPYGQYGSGGNVDDIGTAARLGGVPGAARVGDTLYVTDPNNHTVRAVDLVTQAVSTFAGSTGGSLDGVGHGARFQTPRGIVYDGQGHLFVSDPSDATIRQIDLATANVTTLAGKSTVHGIVDDVGTAARFVDPAALAFDGVDSLYVSETSTNLIRRIYIPTGAVATMVGQIGGWGPVEGSATTGWVDWPEALAVMPSGALVIACTNEPVILQFVQQ